MRTLIVFLCFCRLHDWGHLVDIKKEDVENNLHGSLLHDKDLAAYLCHAVHLTTESAVFTANFEKLNKCLRSVQDSEGNHVICLRGPKGCGKTFTLATTFALYHIKEIQCLLLSAASFNVGSEYNMNYLRSFVRSLNNLAPDSKQKALDYLESKEPSKALQTVLMKADDLLVFADLSFLHNTKDAECLVELLNGVSQFVTMILALSSGAQHFTQDGSTGLAIRNCLSTLLNGCKYVDIECYTEDEAQNYIKKKNTSLQLDDVVHVSGLNPLLLSKLNKDDEQQSVESYTTELETIVGEAIVNNLHGLVQKVKTVKDYLLQNEMLECVATVKLLNKRQRLTDDEQRGFIGTWLFKHKLAVLKDSVSGKILEWNFPVLGEMFTKILHEFVRTTTHDDLLKCCERTPGFAGCWYEFKFFQHYTGGSSIAVQTEDNKTVELKISEAASLVAVQDELQLGVLYQLKSHFPVIDAVGLFEDSQCSDKFLVFFQVSIQKYIKHRTLSDLFSKCHYLKLRAGGEWATGISVFKHYQYLCRKVNKKILVVYVSPREGGKTEGFKTFQSEIAGRSTAKDSHIRCAVLPDDSTFHEQMKKVEPFKRYFRN